MSLKNTLCLNLRHKVRNGVLNISFCFSAEEMDFVLSGKI